MLYRSIFLLRILTHGSAIEEDGKLELAQEGSGDSCGMKHQQNCHKILKEGVKKDGIINMDQFSNKTFVEIKITVEDLIELI